MRSILCWLGVSLTLSGCASFHSIPLMRTADHGIHREWRGKHHAGIPVKLKIPSHVGVTVYEQQVLIQMKVKDKDDKEKLVSQLVSFEPPQYEIETKTLYTDKVFLVDFKRPAAGTLSLMGQNGASGVQFDDEQYFTDIQAKYDEKTLRDITAAIGTIGKGIKGQIPNAVPNAKTTSAGPVGDNKSITFHKSVLAYQQFDVAEADWEFRLNEFTTVYLEKCGSCQVACPSAIPAKPTPADATPARSGTPDAPPAEPQKSAFIPRLIGSQHPLNSTESETLLVEPILAPLEQ